MVDIKSRLNVDNVLVVTRRFFHDDWNKILSNQWEQLNEGFSYKPFHSDKVLVHFQEPDTAKLLCRNKGWSTVGNFFVKFEMWSPSSHAGRRLLFQAMEVGQNLEVSLFTCGIWKLSLKLEMHVGVCYRWHLKRNWV